MMQLIKLKKLRDAEDAKALCDVVFFQAQTKRETKRMLTESLKCHIWLIYDVKKKVLREST